MDNGTRLNQHNGKAVCTHNVQTLTYFCVFKVVNCSVIESCEIKWVIDFKSCNKKPDWHTLQKRRCPDLMFSLGPLYNKVFRIRKDIIF